MKEEIYCAIIEDIVSKAMIGVRVGMGVNEGGKGMKRPIWGKNGGCKKKQRRGRTVCMGRGDGATG